MTVSSPDVTQLLIAEDARALDRVMPLVYTEMQRIARGHLRRERDGHTLNTTALVHEAYLKLASQDRAVWKSRGHFFAVAAVAMRRILINYARQRRCLKRGGDAPRLSFDALDLEVMSPARAEELVALDEALSRLAASNARAAQVVECRFFGGLSVEETAEALGVAPRTVKRDWRLAKAWLRHDLAQSP